MSREPFEKEVTRKPLKDGTRGTYKTAVEYVQVFNQNALDKSPTTSSKTCRPDPRNKTLADDPRK